MAATEIRAARIKRHLRVRAKITGTAARPRLCVFRSLNSIYAQVIDDERGHTLTSASTLDPEIKDSLAGKTKTAQAELIGSAVARRALDLGIEQVAFDRGGNRYHGRIKSLAEAARKEGLKF